MTAAVMGGPAVPKPAQKEACSFWLARSVLPGTVWMASMALMATSVQARFLSMVV
jgi:hypothetical protein